MRTYLIALSLIGILINGCASYVPVPLDRPSMPEIPKIKADELQCLSDSTYKKLYDGRMNLYEYAKKLEIIIDSTKETGN